MNQQQAQPNLQAQQAPQQTQQPSQSANSAARLEQAAVSSHPTPAAPQARRNGTSLQQAVTQSELKTDRLTDIKTVYNVSGFEIFWRNLLAGMARAVGGILVYLFFLSIVGYLAAQIVWPQVKPLVQQYQEALTTINQLNTLNNQAGSPSQIDLQDLVDDSLQKILNDTSTTRPDGINGGRPSGR